MEKKITVVFLIISILLSGCTREIPENSGSSFELPQSQSSTGGSQKSSVTEENMIPESSDTWRMKEEYRKIKENFENYQFKTIQEMQEFYKNLYQNSGKEASRKGHSIYDLLRYKEQNRAMEFNQYQATYGHLVHRYETLRKSKLWKIAKKIKGKCKKG